MGVCASLFYNLDQQNNRFLQASATRTFDNFKWDSKVSMCRAQNEENEKAVQLFMASGIAPPETLKKTIVYQRAAYNEYMKTDSREAEVGTTIIYKSVMAANAKKRANLNKKAHVLVNAMDNQDEKMNEIEDEHAENHEAISDKTKEWVAKAFPDNKDEESKDFLTGKEVDNMFNQFFVQQIPSPPQGEMTRDDPTPAKTNKKQKRVVIEEMTE
jgi:hypothetical protein